MNILTLTEGGKTYYVNAADIVSFVAQGNGTVLSLRNSVNMQVDQATSAIITMINPPAS